MRLRRKFFYRLLISVIFFVGVTGSSINAAGEVLVNEIAWMGTAGSANAEWIELKNYSGGEIDLTGWILEARDGQPKLVLSGKIAAEGYFLLERTNDESAVGIAANQIYTGALGNAGEYLELKDNLGNVIDSLDAAAGWPAGDNAEKKTLERSVGGNWQTSLNSGGTPKTANSSGDSSGLNEGNSNNSDDSNNQNDPGDSATDNSVSNPSGSPLNQPENEDIEPKAKAKLGDILINELVSDPDDSDVEWVELYNNTSSGWIFEGWTIEDGSGAKTSLSGEIGFEGANKFFVVEKPKGNLNNQGEQVVLKDSEGNLIDQVSYGNWEDKENNAPVAGDPFSLARVIDGYNTFNNANDFKITKKITKSSANIIEALDKEAEKSTGACFSLMFTEILPAPAAGEGRDEFIEIFNGGTAGIDLNSWSLKDESGKEFIIKKTAASEDGNPKSGEKIIQPNEYLVFYRVETKISLNNSGDKLELYEPESKQACKNVEYGKAVENDSYSYDFLAKRWVWSQLPTPAAENVIKKANTPPVVDFNVLKKVTAGEPASFDSSDTIDEESKELKFFWDFGDSITNQLPNPEHTFLTAGSFVVKLAVWDGQATATKEKIIKVSAPGAEGDKDGETVVDGLDSGINLAGDQPNLLGLKLNEIFPDPAGSDLESEFIELWNSGATKINIANWTIRDGSQSGKFSFKDNLWLEPDGYYVLNRDQSGLTLNNDSDQARLFDSLDEIIDKAEYSSAMEGASYSRGENEKWFWTTKITPGKKNIIAAAEADQKFSASPGGATAGNKIVSAAEANDYEELNLYELAGTEKGRKVKVTGVVAVLPGVLGSQYFYISQTDAAQAASASSDTISDSANSNVSSLRIASSTLLFPCAGIQVYNYKKEFPVFKASDFISVQGEIAESSGEKRIKTSVKDDIKIIRRNQTTNPVLVNGDEMENIPGGCLVKIAGLITGKKGYEFYLDDGQAEVVGYVKQNTGIKTAVLKTGDTLELTGILIRNESGTKILPRNEADLAKKEIASEVLGETVGGSNGAAEVVGEIANGDWQVAQRDRKLELFKYLLIISGATVAGLIVWLIKLMKEKD